ncbi:uncharacterized protein [Maniola hyperantus]|uniref:uncharacterized protein n=1 Tax=Aphantopus hyperantus TaxID=2795564 RepID=UPI003748DED6
MGGAKFVVYGGQRWRELEQASGRVAGWGDVSFVCARRGRLELVPRAAVLRALRALAAAGARSARHRGAARDGPRLSQIRYPATGRQWQRRERRQWEGCSAAHHVHSCCQQRALQYSTDANFNSLLKPATITVGVQCSAQGAAARATLTLADADDLMQQSPAGLPQRNRDHEQEFRNKDNGREELESGDQGRGRLRSKGHGSVGLGRRTLISSKKKRQSTSSDSSASVMAAEAPRKRNLPTKTRLAREAVNTKVVQVRRNVSHEVFTSDSDFEPQRQKIVQRNKALTGKAIETKVRRKHSPESASSDADVESRRKKKLHRSKGHGSKGSRNKDGGSEGSCEQTQNTACKELLISEETVMLLRRFIENDDSNVFGVDLALYDTDDAYKAQFFYRLNPIVDLQRGMPLYNVFGVDLALYDTDDAYKAQFFYRLNPIVDLQRGMPLYNVFGVDLALYDTDDAYKAQFFYRLNPIVDLQRGMPLYNVFGVDLALYDTDDAYKAQFFYRLNPIVDLQRYASIQLLLPTQPYRRLAEVCLYTTCSGSTWRCTTLTTRTRRSSSTDSTLSSTCRGMPLYNVFGVDLALYDTDDAYKAQFFYRLNPIVDLQRCPQISRMLRDRASRADSVSLEDFVANLGLRSVTEPGAGQTRYRMRARRKSDVTDVRTRSHSDSELDKENSTRAAPRGKRDDTQVRRRCAGDVTDTRTRQRGMVDSEEQVDRVLEENKRNKLHNHRSKSHSNSKTEARDSSKDLQEVVDVTNYQERSKKPKELDGTSNKGRKDLKGVGDVTDNKGRKDLKGVDVTDNKGRKDLKGVGDVTDNKGRKDLKGVGDVTDNKGRKDLKGVGDVTDNKGRKDLKGVGDVTDNKKRKDLKGVGDVTKKKEGRNDLKDVGDVSNKKEGKKELKEVDGTNNKERKELKAVGDVSNKKEGRKEQKEVGGRNSNKEEGGKKKKDVLAKGRGGGMREYSAEEDAHIVRWVRGAGRAHLVNGNRLWAQLQPLHQADTGCFRSWQSLRNRYLRYLLPALAVRQLLPAHEAARLRAAAATGEMKARQLPARRNSAFQQPPVRSAWGRLPRPKPQETLMISDAEEEASQTRSLRSANATNTHTRAADRSPPTDTLTRAADRSPPTDTLTRAADRSPPNDTLTRAADRSPPNDTLTRAAGRSSPTYSELTKRFALRHRSTPNSDSTDTSSGPSDSTTSTDRRVSAARRRRAASASPTRQRDTSVRSVDTDSDSREVGKADRRRGEHTERNVTKKRVRSKSLGSDTDSERRRASSSDTSGRQIDSGRQLADEKESNKRRRTRSQDSDTDSHRPNKRLRSYSSGRHNGTRADKSDRHRDESAQRADTNKQSGVKSDSLRLNGKVTEPRQRLNADQSLIKNRRQSGKRGRRSDKHVRNDQDSDKSDGQTENSFRRADKSRSAQDIDKTDRQNGSTRDGVKNDPPRDKGEVTKKRRLNADLLGGSHRQSQGDPPSDTSDRHGDRSSQRERDKGERAPRTRRLYNHNAM